MVLTEEQRLLLRRSFIITPAVINFVLIGGIAWVIHRGRSSVALWGADGMGIDIILTSFLLPFLTCLIVMLIVWRLFEQGDQSAVSWTRFDFWWLAWLPQGKWARAVEIGAATALGGSAILLSGLDLLKIENLSPNGAIVLKASYGAVLAGLVTPLLALASLADVSRYLRETPGKATEAIPIAQLPPGSQKSHLQMMKTDMIGYTDAARAIVRFIALFYNRISGLPVPAWLPTKVNREMRRQIAIIEAWLSPMIAERKAESQINRTGPPTYQTTNA